MLASSYLRYLRIPVIFLTFFVQKTKKPFLIFPNPRLLRRTQHGRKWLETDSEPPANVTAHEKTPPELLSAAFFKADGETN